MTAGPEEGRLQMVDFSLSDEERQIRDTVRSFIEKEVIPLEPEVLRNERAGRPGLAVSTLRELQNKARRSGFWGVNTPEEYGGMDLGAVMSAIIGIRCFLVDRDMGWKSEPIPTMGEWGPAALVFEDRRGQDAAPDCPVSAGVTCISRRRRGSSSPGARNPGASHRRPAMIARCSETTVSSRAGTASASPRRTRERTSSAVAPASAR